MHRKSSLTGLVLRALLLALTLSCGTAFAQAWPAKPVRIIVPFAPGGTSDMLGRLVAQKLTESLKQAFVVENVAGAGGLIGSDKVAKASPRRLSSCRFWSRFACNRTNAVEESPVRSFARLHTHCPFRRTALRASSAPKLPRARP